MHTSVQQAINLVAWDEWLEDNKVRADAYRQPTIDTERTLAPGLQQNYYQANQTFKSAKSTFIEAFHEYQSCTSEEMPVVEGTLVKQATAYVEAAQRLAEIKEQHGFQFSSVEDYNKKAKFYPPKMLQIHH